MTFCVLGENCTVFDRAEQLSGVTYSKQLCDGCFMRAQSELNLLRYDYVDLSQLIPKKPMPVDSRICRPKPESSPPVAMSVFTLRGQVAYVLAMTEDALRRHLHDRYAVRAVPVREGFALDQSVRYLRPRVDELAGMPARSGHWMVEGPKVALSGVDLVILMGSLHRSARWMCGLDMKIRKAPGDCPSCQVPALKRLDDEPERVFCGHCRHSMSSMEYLALTRLRVHPEPPVTPAA